MYLYILYIYIYLYISTERAECSVFFLKFFVSNLSNQNKRVKLIELRNENEQNVIN